MASGFHRAKNCLNHIRGFEGGIQFWFSFFFLYFWSYHGSKHPFYCNIKIFGEGESADGGRGLCFLHSSMKGSFPFLLFLMEGRFRLY